MLFRRWDTIVLTGDACHEKKPVIRAHMRDIGHQCPVSGRARQMTDKKNLRQARFWKKFLRLTRGRITPIRALEIIRREEQDDSFSEIIGDLIEVMRGGIELSEAMEKHSSEFSLSIVELVQSAEKTGAWDEILAEIATGLEDGTST